jgi:hypothetical protein
MSIKEGTSEIVLVFACYRPMVTGNSATKDSAIADAWRMSVVRSGRIGISNAPSASVTMARNEHAQSAEQALARVAGGLQRENVVVGGLCKIPHG